MNHCNLQQNAVVACEELRSLLSVSDPKGPLICPKPRRVGMLANNSNKSFRCYVSHQAEVYDSKAGAELLDIILRKEDFVTEQPVTPVSSSPPFFCGSPPSRAANPIVHDACFGDERLTPISTLQIPSPSGLSSPSSCKGGCVRMKFGLKPAAVRVEGFDCLNRDRQNSSIPAMA
ncbi:hypothetical protein SLEP1_g10691 [Rubroshorea leprosula]|uniref:Uncharacterized protein n=1 Tax=Rubroshorea leprosula TaxID=152421 RepID=A0AAV5I8V2_9ROSI|nr:hypothetical protein SLEP1_g10691 [Rubroshorea leprosula]